MSLHSHTLHSQESLTILYRVAGVVPVIAAIIRRGEERYRRHHGSALDLSRGWWTPPLGPYDAWTVEKAQIEELDLDALVSLTDHDNIEAPESLQVVEECREVPISFEWTVPFGPTFFHLGVHNLPAAEARRRFEEMSEYTCQPCPERLGEILSTASRLPGALLVFNHPLWDEAQIGYAAHSRAAQDLIRLHGTHLHAIEFNGLRPWRENCTVLALAEAVGLPVVSGGDRHGLEPNANINLTNATSFAEFAEEVRGGRSEVLVLPRYRESHASRIVHGVIDVLRTHERHANGWKLWSDRVFYRCDDGRTRSLTELFASRPPAPVSLFVGLAQLASLPRVQRFLHGAFSTGEGVAL